jgi:hypothetical protein
LQQEQELLASLWVNQQCYAIALLQQWWQGKHQEQNWQHIGALCTNNASSRVLCCHPCTPGSNDCTAWEKKFCALDLRTL